MATEIYGDEAASLLVVDNTYHAPSLVFAETGNILWKKVRRGEITADESQQLAVDLRNIAVETVDPQGLLLEALDIALAIDDTVYDAMYLALAVRLDTKLITADERLAQKTAGSALADHVISIRDFHHS